jgi:hypothetical protein
MALSKRLPIKGKVQHLSEEFPIGIGRDDHHPTKAAIQAINHSASNRQPTQ